MLLVSNACRGCILGRGWLQHTEIYATRGRNFGHVSACPQETMAAEAVFSAMCCCQPTEDDGRRGRIFGHVLLACWRQCYIRPYCYLYEEDNSINNQPIIRDLLVVIEYRYNKLGEKSQCESTNESAGRYCTVHMPHQLTGRSLFKKRIVCSLKDISLFTRRVIVCFQ